MGEDLTEIGYIEISARRLAAQRAASELDSFESLPNVDPEKIRETQQTFAAWEASAEQRLVELEQMGDLEHHMLHRRQAQALSRITVREVLRELAETGVVSESVARDSGDRIVAEIELA